MSMPDRILMGPGPSNPYPEATLALGRPLLGHLDPAFLELLDETNERLRRVFRTANPLTFPLSATGSGGMEAAFANVVAPGDAVVVGVNGLFGERMADVARRHGAEVVRVEAPWGRPLDPQALLDAHPAPRLIAAVHAETSTGVRNDVACLGAGRGDALLLVDCVTSLGGIPVEIDAWSVDLAYAGTQKCLGVAPGLAPFTASPRAVEAFVASPSWYFDLGLIARYVTGDAGPGATTRTYHHTAPVAMVQSLHAALGVLLDEGLEQVWERHRSCGCLLQDGLERLGLELVADKDHRLPELTTVRVPLDRLPPGMTEAAARAELLARYGIEIGGGLGPHAGTVWRIGCMGHTARRRNVILVLGAIEELLAA
jgi:alanine-glyoxylate transaminase / serine-glyoxylate transaminase / serine-pyruvate transaminase